MPVTLIGEAVFARCLSSIKDERVRASKVLDGPQPQFSGDRQEFIDNLEQGKRPFDAMKLVLILFSGVCVKDHLVLSRLHAYSRCASIFGDPFTVNAY